MRAAPGWRDGKRLSTEVGRKIINGRADPPPFFSSIYFWLLSYFPRLTAFFSSAPALNLATRRAAILMVAPVCGLRPLRALRCEIEKVPNPIRATRSPFFKAPVMLSTVVSMAEAAWVLLMPQLAAMRSIKSALFIVAPGEGLAALSEYWCAPSVHDDAVARAWRLAAVI